jgi:glycosyltransferase involved in cell wall biosynthesis
MERKVGCDVVIPCRDEAAALPLVLAAVPEGFHPIVVDNGSTDGTADVARRLGATVVGEPRPGYGAAVHAGVLAASSEHVAVVDGDDSMDLGELPKLLTAVVDEGVTMAVGRRCPVGRGVWPWHARAGTTLLATWLRRSSGFGVHDLAPMRVCRRDDLLALDIRDRRFGYPLELMVKAARAGWTVCEIDIAYRPRAAGTRSKVSGSLRGTGQVARDFMTVLAETR